MAEDAGGLRQTRNAGGGQLGRVSRGFCWMFGLAFSAAGVYAVFATENQAGSAVLLILSALFSVIALTGRVPHRLQFGENSVEWPEQVTEAVTEVIEHGSPEAAEKVVAAIADAAPPQVQSLVANRMLGRTLESLAHGILTIAAVQKAADDANCPLLQVEALSCNDDELWDFSVSDRGNLECSVKILVAVKRAVPLTRAQAEKFTHLATSSFTDNFLVLVFGGLSDEAIEVFERQTPKKVQAIALNMPFDIGASIQVVRQYLDAVI